MIKMKMGIALLRKGFTLVELMVAAATSLIVIGTIMSSVITFQQMSQGLDDKLKREAEIQRALHFIAADIQEGQLVQSGADEYLDYNPVFQIKRPDNSLIVYYTKERKTEKTYPWTGPQAIFRRDLNDEDPDPDAIALIDQISAQSPSGCGSKVSDEDTLVNSGVGLSLIIHGKSKATICIRGDLKKSSEDLEGSIQASTRVGAS
jgi:type II secretory pathway pseudopilin PulG